MDGQMARQIDTEGRWLDMWMDVWLDGWIKKKVDGWVGG